ncbi:MAG: DUF4145 domain-containing protein [Patescibacteria group bacterium]
MNRGQTATLLHSAIENLIDTCPHCDTRAHLKLLFQESQIMDNRDVVYYATFRCVPCEKLIVKTYRFKQNQYDSNENLSAVGWQEKFPGEEVVYANKFEGPVPPEVLEDFKEGVICLYNKCSKAAVSMFRRALQSSLLERGANPKEDLVDQIKNATYLTQDIKDWAHNIRIFGNWGAHPQDDLLKDADEKTAKETQSFLEEFFNYVYVMPSRVANARQKNMPPAPSAPPKG